MASATPDKIRDCAVVIGVGASQGIGAAVCHRFAKEG
ncbi:short-chain dehydrogenase, partial [Acinetobacter baumannii]